MKHSIGGWASCFRSRLTWLIALALFAVSIATSNAQTGKLPAPATRGAEPVFDASHLPGPQRLATTWLVHGGDSLSYAAKDFDDTGWSRFDGVQSLHGLFPADHPEVVWYRLHVSVTPHQTGLGLLEHQISSAFEVYVNGRLLMSNGQIAPFVPDSYNARLLRPIPDEALASGAMVIALRVHISRTEWSESGPGFVAENLMIGQKNALEDYLWLNFLSSFSAAAFSDLLAFGVGIVALALFTAQRRRLEYLWIFGQGLIIILGLPPQIFEYTHNVPAHWEFLRQFFNFASVIFEVLMFLAFLRRPFGWWARSLLLLVLLGTVISQVGQTSGSISQVGAILAQFPTLFVVALVLPVLLGLEWRRGNREAGILLIPIVLQSLGVYWDLIGLFLIRFPALVTRVAQVNDLLTNFHVGPLVVTLDQVNEMLYFLSLAIIMVLRSTRMTHQQAVMESELEAAREVQQVLLPDQIDVIPGFSIETSYQPAQQVGGDFFQVLPTGDGGMILVLGDVAGKGLPAAMLVSVLVGAIRATVVYTQSPTEILSNLNERLVGRANSGFSTALVARFDSDGVVTIANAGHLSPYLDGLEIELPGALPLGVAPGALYDPVQFEIPPGSRLTFYSDGVVEAQNAKGELYGFERAAEVSTQPAASIMEAACAFGQSDDITVVVVSRVGVLAAV